MIEFIMILGAFLIGLCVGSFLNVCIWRIPRGEDIIFTPSHCTGCGHKIKWYENIPLVSYLVLRGKCSECGGKISSCYFWVELATGVLFLLIWLQVEYQEANLRLLGIYLPLIMMCVTATVIDLRFRIVPDLVTLPVLVYGVIYYWVLPPYGDRVTAGVGALVAIFAIGGGLALFAKVGKKLCRREILGMGDVKFMAAVAALMGLLGGLLALLAGAILGFIYGIIFLHGARRRKAFAFIPFLAAGTIIVIFATPWLRKIIYSVGI